MLSVFTAPGSFQGLLKALGAPRDGCLDTKTLFKDFRKNFAVVVEELYTSLKEINRESLMEFEKGLIRPVDEVL